MSLPRPGSDLDHYGPYTGHPSDPRSPEPPEAVCETCGHELEGQEYMEWQQGLEDELVMPEHCSQCVGRCESAAAALEAAVLASGDAVEMVEWFLHHSSPEVVAAFRDLHAGDP